MHRSSLKRHCWPIKQKQKKLVKFQLYGDLISLNGKVDVFGLFGFLMNAVQYWVMYFPRCVSVEVIDECEWVQPCPCSQPPPPFAPPTHTEHACWSSISCVKEAPPSTMFRMVTRWPMRAQHVAAGQKQNNWASRCQKNLSSRNFSRSLQTITKPHKHLYEYKKRRYKSINENCGGGRGGVIM